MRIWFTVIAASVLLIACDLPIAEEREESSGSAGESGDDDDDAGMEDPLFNDEDATQPPFDFTVTEIEEELVGGDFQLRWALAEGVGFYSVQVSQEDEDCSDPYITLTDIKALRTDFEDLKSGENYVCVFAHNRVGQKAATNNGILFSADVSPPVITAAPVGPDSPHTEIETLFTWEEIEDVGPAGFSHVRLEITIVDSEEIIFNGPIANRQDHSVILEQSTTIRARIKAFDKADNESEWSEWSAPVEVDLD